MAQVQRKIVTLDSPEVPGRRLAESARGAGFTVTEADSIESFVSALSSPDGGVVGVVAFERLWPEPQRQLRALRDRLAGVRLAVVHSDGSPRMRMGQRLWAIGLMDYFLPRSMPPHDLAPVLRQAYADAVIERATEEFDTALPPAANRLHQRVRVLHSLGVAFTTQTSPEGLLRELQAKLPSFIDYHALAVLVTDPRQHAMHVFQSRPAAHEVIWKLAEMTVNATTPFVEVPIAVEELVFQENTSESAADEADAPISEPSARTVLTIPMVLHGELIGCISILVADAMAIDAEERTILRLVAYHLCSALYSARILREAEHASLIDDLTGASNRRQMTRLLKAEWSRSARHGDPLSVAMLDIDHFKNINDQHGHLIGDAVLRGLASIIRENLRDTDHLIRYGGEEFLVLLPQTGSLDAALVVERIRLAVLRQPVYKSETVGPIQVTFSAGVATYPDSHSASEEELVELADQALLHAKQTGRDRICVAAGGKFDALDDLKGRGKPAEKRRYPRIGAEFPVKYVPLPGIRDGAIDLATLDISEGGIAIRGKTDSILKNEYGLVYLEDEEKPVLAQVAWTRESEGTKVSAGLRFLSSKDLETPQITTTAVRPKAAVMVQTGPTREVIRRVLKAAEFDSFIWQDSDGPLTPEQLEGCSLFVVGDATLRAHFGERFARFKKDLKHPIRMVVVGEESDRNAALATIRNEKIDHLMGRDAASEVTFFATLKKLLLGNYFGIRKYLLWGAEARTWHLTSAERKDAVLEGIRNAALGVQCHPRLIDLLVLSVDEMLINALYHPKRDGNEIPSVTVECGSDGRMLAVAVIDDKGQFERNQFFEAIERALEAEKTGVEPTARSASLGFRIMLSGLSHLVVNVDPGRCTEIIGLVDLRRSLREHKLSPPGLGMFTKGG